MKTIVVPFDFSLNARQALSYALQLAELSASPVFVYHIVHESPYKLAAAPGEKEMEEMIRNDESEKTKELEKLVAELLSGLGKKPGSDTIRVAAEYSALIVEKVIDKARALDAGLVVMGTHGASGIKKLLFGSNTAHMIARSPIPVLAIPENYPYKPVSKLLFAADLENLEDELGELIPFAIRMHAVIDVLHFDYGPNDKKISIDTAERVIRFSPYQFIMLHNREASLNRSLLKQINMAVQEMNPGWLVMFTRGRSFWDKILTGSRTESMAQSLPVPLLSFKKPG